MLHILILASIAGLLAVRPALAEHAAQLPPADVQSLLAERCFACHGGDAAEGDVRLDNLAGTELDERLELLNRAQQELFFGRMPPQDAPQPTAAERAALAAWLSSALGEHDASKLEDKLRRPEYGNYVDHQKLFSGQHADLPGFTYDRRWLISEYIFDAKFNRLLNHQPALTIDGKREHVVGSNNRRVNLTNPFLLPPKTGVRYYANETLNGGHLLTMLTNAKEAASHMVYLAKRDRRYLPAIADVMALQWEHERILASRSAFLDSFIERVLRDLYQDDHDRLLPQFVRVDAPRSAATDAQGKKAPYHAANPGKQEVVLIFRTIRRRQKPGATDEQLIEDCEREWFNHGHDPRRIQARITFLNGYMAEFRKQVEQHRYHEKHKPLVYRPLADAEMQAVTEAILEHREQGDRFDTIIDKCADQWKAEFARERAEAGPPNAELTAALVEQLFVKILERAPDDQEAAEYAALTRSYIASLGRQQAVEKLIQTLILNSEFVYRSEFGEGKADEHGRRMMSPRDASYAIAYALTDSSPDEQLAEAAAEGRLETREDYEREVRRLLARRDQFYVIDEAVQRLQLTASFTNLPIRELRFFREFFGYPQMLPIFKDNKRFGGHYDNSKGRLVGEADRLVEHILESDENVFEQLLTTDRFYVYHSGDNQAMKAASDRIRTIYEHFKDEDWETFGVEDLLKHKEFLAAVKMRGVNVENLGPKGRRNPLREFKTAMESFTMRFAKGQAAAAPYNSFPAHGPANASTRNGLQLRSPEVAKFFSIDMAAWNYEPIQPARVDNRKGLLTHPAWLIAHAQNTSTDPVVRGRWIREKLLAGVVPDVPVTVDAVIPEDPHATLRQRLEARTNDAYCWSCHQKMNPLGLAFEMYDDFGRHRTRESLEHPQNLVAKGPDKAPPHVDLRDTYETLPVDPRGRLDGTGDDSLDGEVQDALDLIDRLARAERVRQSIIRHAFRYFMGRNEMLSDSKTLIAADRAYVQSGGSFDAVVVSLLTSDSFIYRKAPEG